MCLWHWWWESSFKIFEIWIFSSQQCHQFYNFYNCILVFLGLSVLYYTMLTTILTELKFKTVIFPLQIIWLRKYRSRKTTISPFYDSIRFGLYIFWCCCSLKLINGSRNIINTIIYWPLLSFSSNNTAINIIFYRINV